MVQIVLSGGVLQMCFNREYIFAIKSVKDKYFFDSTFTDFYMHHKKFGLVLQNDDTCESAIKKMIVF